MTEKHEYRGVLVVPDPGPPTPTVLNGGSLVLSQRRFSQEGRRLPFQGGCDAEEVEADDEPLHEKMRQLRARLQEQFAENARLEGPIRENLRKLGIASMRPLV